MTTLLGWKSDELAARDGADTAREIAQQPDVWRAIARDRAAADDRFVADLLRRPELRVVLTGAGSSAFAGRVLAPLLSGRLARRVDAVASTDIVAAPREHLAEDVPTLLVSLARSGDSPESVAATRLAEGHLSECFHLVVTCNRDGALAHEHSGRTRSRVLLLPAIANDRGFAMTSSFTGMMLAARLALDGAPVEVEPLAAAAEHVLHTHLEDARALAATGCSRLVYLGSGALQGLAAESALKALELTAGGVVALSDSALGFRHGPKSVLDERTLVVVFESTDPYTRRYDEDIVAELGDAVGPGRLVTIGAGAGAGAGGGPGPGGNAHGGDRGDRGGRPLRRAAAWRLPGLAGVDDAGLALPAAVCAQLIAFQLSLTLGRTPDDPFPGGQVNRVVRGVTVHPFP